MTDKLSKTQVNQNNLNEQVQTEKESLKVDNLSESEKNSQDIQKALLFFMSKEMQHKSLEEKKKYLATKISKEAIDEAILLLPTISNLIDMHKSDNKVSNTLVDYLKGFSIYTSLILATLGINYVLDLTRNKKNEVFYRNVDSKLQSEVKNLSENLQKNVFNQMEHFVKTSEFSELYKKTTKELNLEKGIILNPLPNSIKVQVSELKDETNQIKQKIDNYILKNENSKIMQKQEILNECAVEIEKSNNDLKKLMKDEQMNFMVKLNELCASHLEKMTSVYLSSANFTNKSNINEITNSNTIIGDIHNTHIPNVNLAEINTENKEIKINKADIEIVEAPIVIFKRIVSNINDVNKQQLFINGIKQQFDYSEIDDKNPNKFINLNFSFLLCFLITNKIKM